MPFFLYAENLEKNKISVWVDTSNLGAGVDFLKKIGQAIIECQVRLEITNILLVLVFVFSLLCSLFITAECFLVKTCFDFASFTFFLN